MLDAGGGGETPAPGKAEFLKQRQEKMIAAEWRAFTEGKFSDAVKLLYVDVLGREVDEDGLSVYSGQLQGGRHLGEVRRELATSGEMRERATELAETNRELAVSNLYFSILGRPMDQGGRETYVTNTDMSMSDIVDTMAGSPEFRDRFLPHEKPQE